MNQDIKKLQSKISIFCEERDWDKFHTPKNLAISICLEAAKEDLILNKDKKNLPDRTIQYSNPIRPATYCRNVGKRRRWEFAIKKTEKIETILSDKYIWNF